jgi:hypothetical protein
LFDEDEMNMTRKEFRWLLAGYIIVVTLTILSDFWAASAVPDIIKAQEPSVKPAQFLPLYLLQGAFLFSVLGAGLIAYIGMFCFWSPARYIFLAAVLLKIISPPIFVPWMIHTGWEELFGELELFLDGVILTLCFLGPAKNLFENKEKSKQVLEMTT